MKYIKSFFQKLRNLFIIGSYNPPQQYKSGDFICGPGNTDYGRDTPKIRKKKMKELLKQRKRFQK